MYIRYKIVYEFEADSWNRSEDIQNSFFSFFNVYVFVNNKRTVIARIFF